MKIEYVQKVLQEKIAENAKIVKINIDELDLSIQETSLFIEFAKKELKKLNYEIYYSGSKYIIDDKEYMVEGNELIVAIKNI